MASTEENTPSGNLTEMLWHDLKATFRLHIYNYNFYDQFITPSNSTFQLKGTVHLN